MNVMKVKEKGRDGSDMSREDAARILPFRNPPLKSAVEQPPGKRLTVNDTPRSPARSSPSNPASALRQPPALDEIRGGGCQWAVRR
jgi:hypothetical protein